MGKDDFVVLSFKVKVEKMIKELQDSGNQNDRVFFMFLNLRINKI